MDTYEFLIKASEKSKFNADHWFRYLRKLIFEGRSNITKLDYERLMRSPQLTNFQKSSLKRALMFGSPTHQHIVGLNKPAKLKNIERLKMNIKEGKYAKIR